VRLAAGGYEAVVAWVPRPEEAPPIENWVKLEPGVPKRLHFTDHAVTTRRLTDPVLGIPKDVRSLIFLVDRVDGRPVSMMFSVVSERLAGELSAYLPDKRYRNYEFTLIKDAPGMVAPRILVVSPV